MNRTHTKVKGNIGVFDSGLGGLLIMKRLVEELEGYHLVYFADQAHVPYGEHTPEEVFQYSKKVTDFLISKNCQIIVIACNTATSASIDKLRALHDVPFVGVEPAVKVAVERSQTGRIGVLATKVTAEGERLQALVDKFAHGKDVHIAVGHGLVELVERGQADGEEAEALLREYIEPMLREGVDELVLGCTHYSFLVNTIKRIVDDKIDIIDPTEAVVRRVLEVVELEGVDPTWEPSEPELYTSGQVASLTSNFPFHQFVLATWQHIDLLT